MARASRAKRSLNWALDGDDAVQARIPGFVNLAHASRSKQREDFVGTESGTGLQHGSLQTLQRRCEVRGKGSRCEVRGVMEERHLTPLPQRFGQPC